MLVSPGPTSSARCTARSSTSASTSSRPPPSALLGRRSASTASPSKAYELNVAAARIAREVADELTTPTAGRASSPARSARAPSSPTPRPDPLRRAARRLRGAGRGLLEGGVDLLLIETQLRPAQVEGGDDRLPAGDGAPPAARCRCRCRSRWRSPAACCPAPRSAPRSPSLDAMRPDVIGLNCATGPAEMSEHLRHLSPALAACRSRACPTPACRRWSTARCTTTSRPSSSPSTTPLRHRARRAGRRRLLRHHARAPPPGRRGGARPRRRRARTPSTSRASRRSTRPVPLDQDTDVPDHRRAHQRQRLEEVPRGDARRRLGHAACRWPSEQIKEGAHVLDVCVDYVGRDGTARHGRDRPALRHPGQRAARARLHRAAR